MKFLVLFFIICIVLFGIFWGPIPSNQKELNSYLLRKGCELTVQNYSVNTLIYNCPYGEVVITTK